MFTEPPRRNAGAAPAIGTAPGGAAGPAGTAASTTAAPAARPIGTSPQKLLDAAYADYRLGQYDLAIAGFEAFIKYFPRAERAADAQVNIGHSYLQAGKHEQGRRSVRRGDPQLSGRPDVARGVLQEGLALRA